MKVVKDVEEGKYWVVEVVEGGEKSSGRILVCIPFFCTIAYY